MTNLHSIISKTRKDLLRSKANILLVITIVLLCILSIGVGSAKYSETNANISIYRKEVREHWEHRPAKHPHRMAHYGYLVFRMAHPLSIFDTGLNDFLGNVIFLEAHKQNTANLSEAGSSGVLVRFGAFSSAFLLQSIVPLIIIFFGFALITRERENATLKILNTQGASGRAIIWGKIIGLWQFSLLFLIPVLPVILWVGITADPAIWENTLVRTLWIFPVYALYFFLIATVAVLVSAFSKSSASSLVYLIGIWLLFTIFLPKIVQFTAQNLYPTPSRIAFETDLEKDILKTGDSHNPEDPYFKNLKDSLLARYQVSEVTKLPFNYSGFVMKKGEEISSEIYIRHQKNLRQNYKKQILFSDISAFADPLLAIKNFSMMASATDFFTYSEFQNQAEKYRYKMAQKMNDLQIENISNIKPDKGGPPAIVAQENWKKFPDFRYQYPAFGSGIRQQWLPVAALLFWLIISVIGIELTGRNLKLL